ncbi:MAG: hypothetical protein GY754_32555 [bacterium]|nr:hypothetical protein [bacterium]
MKIDDCKNCEHHIEKRADSVLCSIDIEIVHRVVNDELVVGCPKVGKKKGLFSRK